MTKQTAIRKIARELAPNWENSSFFSRDMFIEEAKRMLKERDIVGERVPVVEAYMMEARYRQRIKRIIDEYYELN